MEHDVKAIIDAEEARLPNTSLCVSGSGEITIKISGIKSDTTLGDLQKAAAYAVILWAERGLCDTSNS